MIEPEIGTRVTYTINGRVFRGVLENRVGDIVRLRCTRGRNNGACYLTRVTSNDWAIGWDTKAAHALKAQTILESSA